MANVEEKFVADDGVSMVPDAVTPEGGEGKKDKLKKTTTDEPKGAADGKKGIPGQSDAGKPVPTAEETEVETVEEVVVESSIESIIEGEDLSEEFKGKISLVFEAALNEEVNNGELLTVDRSKKYESIFGRFSEKLGVSGAYDPQKINFDCLKESVDGFEGKC